MPGDDEAEIINHRPAEQQPSWQFRVVKNGVHGNWTGDYKTAQEALATLQKECDEQIEP